MLDHRQAIDAAVSYLRTNPEEIRRFLQGGRDLRFGVPLAAFRWLIEQLVGDAQGMDPEIEAHPPGLRVSATLEKMQTRMRASATITIAGVQLSAHEMRMDIRLQDVALTVLSTERTVVSALINSGALSLARTGDLVRELPGMPGFVVQAEGERVVVDLMKAPSLGDRPLVRHLMGLSTAILTVQGVETEEDHLDVMFRPLPQGTRAALFAMQNHLLSPAMQGMMTMLDRFR